jgi:hypothetical protein
LLTKTVNRQVDRCHTFAYLREVLYRNIVCRGQVKRMGQHTHNINNKKPVLSVSQYRLNDTYVIWCG